MEIRKRSTIWGSDNWVVRVFPQVTIGKEKIDVFPSSYTVNIAWLFWWIEFRWMCKK